MKTTLILVICILFSAGILCASTSPIPATVQAPAVISTAYPGPISYLLVAGDGSPAPLCAPGHKCNDDQFKLQAGDGSPAPLCAPGHKCNDDQFKLQAGDGSPAPLCAPGHKCNDDQFKLQALL